MGEVECGFLGSSAPPRCPDGDWLRRDSRQAPLDPNIITTRQHQPSRLFDLDSSRNMRFVPTIDINTASTHAIQSIVFIQRYVNMAPIKPAPSRRVDAFHLSLLHQLSSRDYPRPQHCAACTNFKLFSLYNSSNSTALFFKDNPCNSASSQSLVGCKPSAIKP